MPVFHHILFITMLKKNIRITHTCRFVLTLIIDDDDDDCRTDGSLLQISFRRFY